MRRGRGTIFSNHGFLLKRFCELLQFLSVNKIIKCSKFVKAPQPLLNLLNEYYLLLAQFVETYPSYLTAFFLKVIQLWQYPVTNNLHVMNVLQIELFDLLQLSLDHLLYFLRPAGVNMNDGLLNDFIQPGTQSHTLQLIFLGS